MIRNLIFDMGGVLIRFDRELFLDRLKLEKPDRQLLMNQVFLSLEWARMDRGSMTEDQAVESICARVPRRLHGAVEALVKHWDEPLLPVEGMEELIRELKESGYGIYLLSNASFRQHEYWPRIGGSRYFDATLISADEGLVKPQPEIYRLALERFDLRPEECFFIDDLPANVEGASVCGISGAVFHGSAAELRLVLRAAGVRVRSI